MGYLEPADGFMGEESERMPMVSVVLPTYCHVESIGEAIRSVLNQSFQDFELLIIDDGSKDGTREVIEKYAKRDPRIKVYRNDRNSGCPACLCNEMVKKHATGQYIAFQFDDDYWFNWCLESLVKGIAEADFAYGQSVYVNFDDKTLRGTGILGVIDLNRENIIITNYVANNAVLLRRSMFLQLGGFDEEPLVARACDWELWIRIVYKGYRIRRIPQLLSVCYFGRPGSVGITREYNPAQVLAYIHNKLRRLEK